MYSQFDGGISQYGLYTENDYKLIEDVLQSMATTNTTKIEEESSGTNLKLVLTNEDEIVMIFKPKRFVRLANVIFWPLGEQIAYRAVFVIVSGLDGRAETLFEPPN